MKVRVLFITTYAPLKHCTDLIRANPHLENLHWVADLNFPTHSPHNVKAAAELDILSALESLTHLRRLFLKYSYIHLDQIANILHRNPGLQRLALTTTQFLGKGSTVAADYGPFRNVVDLYLGSGWEAPLESTFAVPKVDSVSRAPESDVSVPWWGREP